MVDSSKVYQGKLKKKLIKMMLLVGVLPLLIGMLIAYVQGHKSLQGVIGSSFKALAHESANKTRLLMMNEISRSTNLSKHPTLVLTAQNHNRNYKNLTQEEITARNALNVKMWNEKDPEMDHVKHNSVGRILTSFLKNNDLVKGSTLSLFVTDIRGILIASNNHYPDYLNSTQQFWQKGMEGKKMLPFIGKLHVTPKREEPVFHLSVPILWHGKKVGMLYRVYSAKTLLSKSIESITFGDTGHVMIINSEGIVIDCPILPTGFKLRDPDLISKMAGPSSGWIGTLGNGHEIGKPESIIGHSPVFNASLKTFSAEHQWFTFAWQSSEEIFAPTKKLLLWILAAGIFSIILILVIGSFASRKIVQPIREVQATAIRLGRGENVGQLDIKTGDEIESLANEINTMSRLIQKSFSGLEHKVQEKSDEILFLKEYTESILMSVPDVLLIFDKDLKIEYVNAAFESLTSNPGDNIIGKALNQIKMNCSDSWLSIESNLIKFSEGEVLSLNSNTNSMSPPVSVAKDPLAQSDTGAPEGDKLIFEINEKYFITEFFDVFLKAEKRRKIGLLMRDVTTEKLLQDKLTMAEKLSGLGTLAAGIAHEMNNPLFSIIGFTQGILGEREPEKIKKYANKVLERAKHMSEVILNLSGYSRSNDKDIPSEVDLNKLLDSSLSIGVLDSYTNDIQIIKEFSELPKFNAKPEEIQQIFINIFRNSVQAMEGKGKLFISSQQLDEKIQIDIRDTGPGISQQHISKIFDPFFTTKEQGKGTGLGLNIVYKLVKKYGGEVEIKSSKGNGALFIITFPFNNSKRGVNYATNNLGK